ncbi:sensor histidine kinase [Actinomadura barringtoniae]|uniref:Sensor histidine kinase n=1 Tax=Actinomadura barringtoniae TaxID=1427535 RepID=A0A939PGS7_9ACTN|nr:histidine kinase [Actinomadura barringtoniae]MBO2452370.1 sensor histidine kinase [Actinomadura barringtoniae]
MGSATAAELEERAASGFEKFRRVTYWSFMFAMVGIIAPPVIALFDQTAGGKLPVPVAVAATAGLVVGCLFYERLIRAGLMGRATRRDRIASGAVTALLALMMLSQPVWILVPVFWVGTVSLSERNRRRLTALCLGTAAYCTPIIVAANHPSHWYGRGWASIPITFAVLSVSFAVAVYFNRYQMRMWDLHQEAHAAREAQARLAVTEERVRFSRDLHDLLGHSLSLIAVKSELAMRMTEGDPDRAKAEMMDVRNAARGALREVRAAVRGYRAVEFDAELAGVRAVLEAAGVRCETEPPPELPPEVRSVLAWVIREGATNVIKHSEARRCRISVLVYGGSVQPEGGPPPTPPGPTSSGTVVLEMGNDGARDSDSEAGSGLTGLAERVAVVGGTLTADRDGRDGFLLRVVIPLGEAA